MSYSNITVDKNIKIKKRCFMTATERRYLGNKDDIVRRGQLINTFGIGSIITNEKNESFLILANKRWKTSSENPEKSSFGDLSRTRPRHFFF